MFYSFCVFIYWFPPWMNLSSQETETFWSLRYKDNFTVTYVYLTMAMDLSGKTMFPQAHVCVPQFLQLELYKTHCISKKRGTHVGKAGRKVLSSFSDILSALLLIALPSLLSVTSICCWLWVKLLKEIWYSVGTLNQLFSLNWWATRRKYQKPTLLVDFRGSMKGLTIFFPAQRKLSKMRDR